jgi:hypothetical protein
MQLTNPPTEAQFPAILSTFHDDRVDRYLPAADGSQQDAFRLYLFFGKNGSDLTTPFRLSDGVRSVEKGVEGPTLFACYTMAMGPALLHVIALGPEDFFDVDMYASHLGLAAICPTTEWISIPLMPPIDTAGIARIRAYAREAHRALDEQ